MYLLSARVVGLGMKVKMKLIFVFVSRLRFFLPSLEKMKDILLLSCYRYNSVKVTCKV